MDERRCLPFWKGSTRSRRLSVAVGLVLAAGAVAAGGPAPRDVELAGRPLASFPYFEHVTTFNLDETVSVTVDPKRYPGAAGKTCDVYVVDAKTAAEWQPSIALVGVGPTPVTVTFSTLVQNSTFPVATGSQLGSRAEPCFDVNGTEYCTGLGRAFDLVVDCDRDGYLAGDDYIDGHGDEAAFYVVHDTTTAGVAHGGTTPGLPVACSDYRVPSGLISSGAVRERVYAPATDAIESLPLVVISHGHKQEYNWYNYLQRHLAAYGYVVMSHRNDTIQEDASALTTLEHTNAFLDLIADQCENRVEDETSCGTCASNGLSCGGDADCTEGVCVADHATSFDVCSLVDRIDAGKIVWIGHSRGGNGVVRAYNRLENPGDPIHSGPGLHYQAGDVALISSMAPSDAKINGQLASPGDVPYHLIWGGGDLDVGGRPQPDVDDARDQLAFQLFERATGARQSIYLHGGAHGWYHERCPLPVPGGTDCQVLGASEVDEDDVHVIVLGYYLPLLHHHVHGNEAARDFFWRPWSAFRPQGAPDVGVALEYRSGPTASRYVIDDYESQYSEQTSSSGGPILQNLNPMFPDALVEDFLEDNDCHYDFVRASQGQSQGLPPADCSGTGCIPPCFCDPGTGPPSEGSVPCDLLCAGGSGFLREQPMNGMTRSRIGGTARGVVLEWPVPSTPLPHVYGYTLAGDFSAYEYLSLRVAQMPRHPNTLQLSAPLGFVVALSGGGKTSRIGIGAYGAEILEPYARSGPYTANACECVDADTQCCSPAQCNRGLSDVGWQAEFETIRIRLEDFLANGVPVDLSNLASLHFEFGAGHQSATGRIAIDDVEFVTD